MKLIAPFFTLACHVFGSIIGLHQEYLKLTKAKRDSFKVHITLLDIHPTTLARDLCIFALLEQLLDTPNSKEKEAEIKATIFYAYLGVIMPSYCHQWYEATLNFLSFCAQLNVRASVSAKLSRIRSSA